MSHNERCKDCKVRVRELLEKCYGPVITNYRIPTGTKPEDFCKHPRYSILNEIYASLQKHRGFTEFVRASYVDVDFFLPEQGMIVEFDESQHFTEPRSIALSHYPSDLNIGFSRDAWMKHCDEIHAYDNDPPFRDEQRAWYDTLRDFLPEMKGFLPTLRIFARDIAWCSLYPEKPEDIAKFRSLLGIGKGKDMQIQTDKDPAIARVIIAGPWPGDVARARDILDTVAERWGSNPPTEFLQTPGAFIRFRWPEKYPPVGNVTYPNPEAVEALRSAAERDIDAALPLQIRTRLAEHAKYLTFGADSNNELYQIEFVCIINLSTNERVWTGKSYPNSEQEQQLIRNPNLESHFPIVNGRRVLVLGCHDLQIFNNRWDSRKELLSPWRIETRSEMNRLSDIHQPCLVLHHPHSTDSCGTWRMGWSGLLEKIGSVKNFASNGLYYHDGKPCRNSLQEILKASKQGSTLDFIFYFEKSLQEQRSPAPLDTKSKHESNPKVYPPPFNKIVESYPEIMPDNFRSVKTAGNSNWKLKANDLPAHGFYYQFVHKSDEKKISIQLCLERTRLRNLESVFLEQLEKKIPNLPSPSVDPAPNNQVPDWLTIYFDFEESSTTEIMDAMNTLIHQTYPELRAELNAGTFNPDGIYARLRKELDIFFGKSVIDQKTKFTYRAENEIGYPNKKELDMISLHKPGMHAQDQVRFRVYPHILASHLGLQNADEVIKVLPVGSVTKQERENPHNGDIFIEGIFSDEEEIEKFVKWIEFRDDRGLPGDN